MLAQARVAHLRPALDRREPSARLTAMPLLALSLAAMLLGAGQLACGSSDESLALADDTIPDGYEGMNFYEANGDDPPSIDRAPLGNVPGSYELVSGEPLPACSAGVGQRPTAPPGDPTLACPTVTRETISDFTYSGNPTSTTFGSDAALPGGTYHYPTDPGTLVSDVTADDWHIYGTVSQISGFGIYLSGCQLINAAAYRGIAFRLWGSIGDGGALVFFVGSADNQVASSWINDNKPNPSDPDEPHNLGRCIPLTARYDGTCREARRVLDVSDSPRPTVIQWRDLGEGCPDPSVDPTEITTIAWYLPQPLQGSYAVDIHIDDLRFSDEGPL